MCPERPDGRNGGGQEGGRYAYPLSVPGTVPIPVLLLGNRKGTSVRSHRCSVAHKPKLSSTQPLSLVMPTHSTGLPKVHQAQVVQLSPQALSYKGQFQKLLDIAHWKGSEYKVASKNLRGGGMGQRSHLARK